jgi:hypothetical protein
MCDFRFSRRKIRRWLSSGMLRSVVWKKLTNHRPDDGGGKHLWNVDQFLRDYTVQHSSRESLANNECLQWIGRLHAQLHIKSTCIACNWLREHTTWSSQISILRLEITPKPTISYIFPRSLSRARFNKSQHTRVRNTFFYIKTFP